MNTSNIFIISGPTGTGENTITNKIITSLPNFTRLVTATSRPPRLNEQEGVDYYFFTNESFLKEVEKGNILEHTYVANRDVYYGAYKLDLEKKLKDGFNIIATPDIVGTKFYKENYNAITIFIKPESIESLRRRITNREPNISKEELEKRLANAENEIKNEEYFYDYSVINAENKLEEAVSKISAIIKKHLNEKLNQTSSE